MAASTAGSGVGAGANVTLFSVMFQHAYYNMSGNRCPDFMVVPTPDCAALMSSIGILFQDQGVGFAVTIPQSRVAALASRVAADFCDTSPGYGFWTRLSFFLVLKNPYFVGITALPLGISPTTQNFYASNLQTRTGANGLCLGSGGAIGPGALSPVTGPSVSVEPKRTCTMALLDISGAAVCSARAPGGAVTSLSLAGAPYGLYSVACPKNAGYTGPARFAYVPNVPLTLGLIDLLLVQPAAGQGNPAAFPMLPPPSPPGTWQPDGAVPKTVILTLPFDARATYWHYYVVSQGVRGHFADSLSISGAGAAFTQSSTALPNGEQAVLFAADTPLPLRQRGTNRFKLSGQRHGANGSRDDIAVDWLPSAPAAPVWPTALGDGLSGCSEIYVYV